MARTGTVLVLPLALLALAFRPVSAAEPPRAEVESLAAEAVRLYDEGQHEDALALYREAHDLWPLPELSYMEARCLAALEEPAEAVVVLERALGESPDKGLRRRIQALLREVRPQLVGVLRVTLVPSKAELLVDGTRRTPDARGTLELPAGPHRVTVRAPGYIDETLEVEVPRAGTLPLDVTLARAEAPPSPTPTVTALPPAGERHWYESVAGWSVLGSGLGVGGVAATLLVLVADDRDELKGLQDEFPSVTSTSQKAAFAKRDRANDMELAGFVLVGVGSAAVLTSVILFLTHEGGGPPPEPGVTLAPSALPGGAGLSAMGRF